MGGTPRRLESWKEIASYVGRDVRTAQRWEAEGLPVHRLQHDKLASVFAFADEIEAWLESRRLPPVAPQEVDQSPTMPPDVTPVTTDAGSRRWPWLLGVVTAIIAAFAVFAVSAPVRLLRSAAEPRDETIRAASSLLLDSKFSAAEDLLKRAADRRRDPVVEALIAWALFSEDAPAGEYRRWAERAEHDITTSTPIVEEYFVKGSRAQLDGDSDLALKWYEEGLATGRADYWTINNLVQVYAERGWDNRVVDLLPQLVARHPKPGEAASEAAAFLFEYGDFDAATRYRDTALRDAAINPYARCWLRIMPAQIAWLKGDPADAVRMARDVIARLDVWSWERDETRARAAGVMLLAGQPAEALELVHGLDGIGVQNAGRAMIRSVTHAGDGLGLNVPGDVYDAQAAVLVAAVDPAGTDAQLVRAALANARMPIAHELLEAESLRYDRRWDEAIVHYQRAIGLAPTVRAKENPIRGGEPMATVPVLFGGGSTALTLEAYFGAAESQAAAGRPADAIQLLEKLAGFRRQALIGHLPGTVTWMRGQQRLQQLRAATAH